MNITSKLGIIILTILLLVSCGGGDGDNETPVSTVQPTVTPPNMSEPAENVVITIGNISDLTGVAAAAHEIINEGLDDMVRYFNEEVLVPGVELKIITYDGQANPSRDIPGYEWLKERGADLIFTCTGTTPLTLKNRLARDKIVLFAATVDKEGLQPSGYVFSLGTIPQYEACTLLKWIAENDWDYETRGPAKIGGATWDDAYGGAFFAAMEEYAEAHPDQFEFVGGHLTPLGTMNWGPEVQALKNCDYVFPCTIMTSFIREYRNADDVPKLIGAGIHTAFFGMIHDAKLWDEIDGMLLVMATKWWKEKGTLIDLTKRLLYENHPDEAEAIMKEGSGYAALSNWYPMFDIIAQSVEATGPENWNSQVLYDVAQAYSLIVDGTQRTSYSETKRDAIDTFLMFEASAAEEDIIAIDSEWIPVVREP